MTVEIVREMFGWSVVINLGIPVFWFLAFTLIHDLIYRIHGSVAVQESYKYIALKCQAFNGDSVLLRATIANEIH